MHLLFRLSILLLLFGSSSQGLACASCGSGSGSPLILYPNEKVKAYFGLSRQSSIESIGHDGRILTSAEPETRSMLTLAAGARVSSRISVVVAQPYVRNQAGTTAKTDFGDPYLESRATVNEGAWDRPHVPQVQVILGHKFSLASPIFETEDARQLDVFGNGFDESTAGIDIWWNMLGIKPGLAVISSKSWKRTYSGIEIERGLRSQAVLGIGGAMMESWHLNGGIRVEVKAKNRNDGKVIDESDSRQNDIFASCRWSNKSQEVKVSLYSTGVGSQNKNAVRSRIVTMGLAQII